MTIGARSGFRSERVADDTPGKVREWQAPYAINVHRTLSVHRRASDPTYRIQPDGSVWRAVRTPAGPGTLRLRADPSSGSVHATAWGPGADWLLDSVPSMLGADDDIDGFAPVEPVLRDAWRRTGGSWRIGRTGLVLEALIPAILEQKVTGTEAHRAWRTLLRWHGEPAPGPAPAGMRVAPDAETWRHIPSWDWHRAGVGPQRSETVVRVARVANRMEEACTLPPAERAQRLTAIRGVGVWTAAETLQRAVGDPDAVSVGDFHIPRLVIYNLTGRVSDSDEEMLELLAPYAGHRYRVTRILEMAGVGAPRFGPRLAPRDFRAM